MKLFTRTIEGDPSKPTILLIHGLYSSGSNWYTLARSMGYTVMLVDLPNHGRSEWCDEFSYRSIAEAIKEIITVPTIALGHSLGGRVATMLAAECELVVGLIVVDMSPLSTAKADRAFTLFHSIFLQHLVNARRQGVEDIEAYLQQHGAAKELTSAVDQAYRQMNLEAVSENIMNLPAEWEQISSAFGMIDKPTVIIKGGASPYISEIYTKHYPEKFSNYTIETVEGGTHRLHHEYPDEFVRLVGQFVEKFFSLKV